MPDVTPQLLRAQSLIGEHRLDEARQVLLGALKRAPADPDANNLMCYVLAHRGDAAQANEYARRAAAGLPDSPGVLVNLGNTLSALGRHEEAIGVLTRAVSLDAAVGPRHALAMAQIGAGKLFDAARTCRDGLAREPGNATLAAGLAWALHDAGRTDQSADVLRGAMRASPDNPNLASALAAVVNYVPGLAPEEVFAAHRAYGRILEKLLPPPSPPPIADPDPDRRVRLGMISANFRDHSVAFFIRAMLERLDESAFDLVLYDTAPGDEKFDFTVRKHTLRRVAWLDEGRLDAAIRSDRLDMLMELSGFSLQHRLAVMHLKPAPIGLTYVGYPNTTGINAVDRRIVDSITDPPGAEHFAVERLDRLDPCFLCYTPPPGPSAAARADAAANAGPTFGSFNHLHKLNEPLMALWKRVLDATPRGRLIVKAGRLGDPEVRADAARRFAAAGLGEDRVEVLPPTPTRAEHLALYSRIDVALDTFPYHGTTTSCEALWMGVPVITRMGATHVSRVGGSLLAAAGVGELVAQDEDEYVRLASTLAGDAPRLNAIRRSLREGLAGSVLCDAAGHTRRLEALLRGIWREACESARRPSSGGG